MKTPFDTAKWYSMAAMMCVLIVAGGCGPTYDVVTPPQMVELERDAYSYVAMTHDGVIVRSSIYSQGERADVPGAAREFWVNATRERMRIKAGYALIDEEDVESADGHSGTRLKFGRDQRDSPYVYWITIFATDDRLHIIEAGGREDRFDKARDSVEDLLASYRLEG